MTGMRLRYADGVLDTRSILGTVSQEEIEVHAERLSRRGRPGRKRLPLDSVSGTIRMQGMHESSRQ